LFFNVTIFKVNALEPEFAFFIFCAKRGGLVTEDTFNEMCFEGCNEMKKVSSCHKDMSKLSVSQSKLGLTRVNSCFNTGSTLPQRDNNKLRECIISFSDPGFRREDSGLSIHTCTKKNLIILRESVFLTPDCIIIKCGNSGKHCSLNAIFLNYSYLNIFHILNILLSLKRFFFAFKVFDVLDLNQSTSRRRLDCQEILCQNGGKKFEKANGLGNSWHTSIKKPNLFKLGNKLNSIYLNLNRKGYYRWYCAQNSSKNDRLNYTIREWPNNKILLRFKNEVIQEQIALVDLAKLNGLYSDVVKRRQTILLKSLKFRIIAVYKISQSNGAKTPGIDNISFTDDFYTNKKKYWSIVGELKKITSTPKKYKSSPVKRVWLHKTKYKKRPIGIPTILDRALQQLICLILEPLVELTSDFNSFGFRKYRSAKMAIGVLRELLKTLDKDYIESSSFRQIEQGVPIILHEDKWILDADIEGFFDNINHKYLLENLYLPPSGIQLVKNLLNCGIIDKQIFTISEQGVPQGGILSPVLANFTLNGLENVVYQSLHPLTKSKTRRIQIKGTNVAYPSYLDIVRYADDFVILCRNKFIFNSLVIPEVKKFLQKRGLRLSSKKTKLFRLKDGVKLKFLGYNFHYENKWKVKNKFMYSNHVGSRAIALYPDKSKVNDLIKKLKNIFKKSSNLDAYNLIAKLNPCLRGWGSYFNLGNCARYRSVIKNLVYKMCWKWAHKKHKRWGKKKIAEFYFLTKQKKKLSDSKNTEYSETKTHKKKQKFQKTKNLKWSFHGAVKSKARYSKSSKKSKTIHLYNIVEKGSTVSALTYCVPQNLRKIHAYHLDISKFIEWGVKANQKSMGPFSNIKSALYKKQKGLCFICNNPFNEQELFNNKTHIHHILPISKGGSPDSKKNMALVHPLCHKSIDH
jgi:group II intron reverse transcriptase/maturase